MVPSTMTLASLSCDLLHNQGKYGPLDLNLMAFFVCVCVSLAGFEALSRHAAPCFPFMNASFGLSLNALTAEGMNRIHTNQHGPFFKYSNAYGLS